MMPANTTNGQQIAQDIADYVNQVNKEPRAMIKPQDRKYITKSDWDQIPVTAEGLKDYIRILGRESNRLHDLLAEAENRLKSAENTTCKTR